MTFAAANVTQTGTVVGYPLKFATAYIATAVDCIIFNTEAGVIPVQILAISHATDYATMEGFSYMNMRFDGANSNTASTTATYDEAPVGVTRPSGGYYIQNLNSREIMYVHSDSNPTTDVGGGKLTLIRGCLGTTAKAIADNDFFCMFNIIKPWGGMVAATPAPVTGYKNICYFAMPQEYRAKIFRAA